MKILILEPHGDDALLSCNSILETNNEIHILTFAERPSSGIEKFYPSIKKVEYLKLPNIWYPDGKPLLNTHQVHRDYTAGIDITQKYLDQLNEVFAEEFSSAVQQIRSEIIKIISNDQYDLVLCPSAVVHPYHVAVREAWILVNSEIPTVYYADKYYIQNRYAKEMYEHLKIKWNIENEYNPGYVRLDTENTKVRDILCEVYPTESMLLRFYSDIILWYPCKYMYNSNTKVEELINEME